MCRAYEASNRSAKEMSNIQPSPSEVNKVMKQQPRAQENRNKQTKQLERECKFCGTVHQFVKSKCPAWGARCDNCHGRNHFAVKCKKVNAINAKEDTEDGHAASQKESSYSRLQAIESGNHSRVSALMMFNGQSVRFQLDSGADINTICQKYVKKSQVQWRIQGGEQGEP